MSRVGFASHEMMSMGGVRFTGRQQVVFATRDRRVGRFADSKVMIMSAIGCLSNGQVMAMGGVGGLPDRKVVNMGGVGLLANSKVMFSATVS
jgi:hypothetical protein